MAAPPLPLRLLCLWLCLFYASAGAEEGEALLRFKAALGGAELQSWIPGPAPCLLNVTSWEGVICFEGRVRGIQLENRGLAGRLDLRPLLPLGGLRVISFAGNQFGGSLPDLRILGALKAVFLSDNNFSGVIQGDAFSGMRSLKKVFLSGNAFSGPIPASLGSLPRLMEVRLDRNGFNGGIPEFSQTGLEVFNVSFNNLQGAIPESLSKMDPAFFQGNRGSTLPPLDWPTRLKIVKGVARGLAYLYDELPMLSLPHGHLKSSNVLLDETMDPLLTDYALVPVINVSHAAEVMVAYKSPEVAQFGRPSKKCDVWSLGILILELLTGKFPANFLHKGSGGSDFGAWVSSVTQEEGTAGEVFDGGMGGTADGEVGMRKLLKIGIDCCEENADRRVDMREALERIEQLQEREG